MPNSATQVENIFSIVARAIEGYCCGYQKKKNSLSRLAASLRLLLSWIHAQCLGHCPFFSSDGQLDLEDSVTSLEIQIVLSTRQGIFESLLHQKVS